MKHHTKSITGRDVKINVRNCVEEISDVLEKTSNGRNYLAEKGAIKEISLFNISHSLIESNTSNNVIKNMILNSVIEASKFPLGDLLLSLSIINRKTPSLVPGVRISNECILNETKKLLSYKNQKLFENIIEYSDIDSSINFDYHEYSKSLIEIRNGVKFDFSVNEIFANHCNLSFPIKNNNCKIILIDGSPSEVSELNRIFEYFAETKEKCLLIAKSYPEDVLATMMTNYKIGSLKVIPLERKDDVFSINDLSDFSYFCDSNYISPSKGDLISNYDPSTSPEFLNVSIGNNFINICDESIGEKSKSLKRKIKRKISREKSEDKIKIYNKRLKNLNSKTTSVKLYNNETFSSKFDMNEIVKSIIYYNNCCRSGLVNVNDLEESFSKYFKKRKVDYISFNSYSKAVNISKNLINNLNNLGCIISNE